MEKKSKKRGPRPEAVRKAISEALAGKKKTKAHRAAIGEAVRKSWEARGATKKARPKKGAILARDRKAWHLAGCPGTFEQFLSEKPLNMARANFLYGKGFWVYKQIDPLDGRVLHIGVTAHKEDLNEFCGSSLHRDHRLRELFRYSTLPVVEIVASGLSYKEAREEYKYLQQEEREKGRDDEE